jgi:hypothetical protein
MGKAPRKVHRGEVDAESLPGAAVRRRAAQASMGGRLAIPANKSSLLLTLSSENRVGCGSGHLHLLPQNELSEDQLVKIFLNLIESATIFSSYLHQW